MRDNSWCQRVQHTLTLVWLVVVAPPEDCVPLRTDRVDLSQSSRWRLAHVQRTARRQTGIEGQASEAAFCEPHERWLPGWLQVGCLDGVNMSQITLLESHQAHHV